MDAHKVGMSLIENEEFFRIESSKQRIEFVLKYIRPLSEFREEIYRIADKSVSNVQKCVTRANSFRKNGMDYFQNGDYRSAINAFITAILSAPFPIEEDNFNNELSLAFAHKSLAEFELKDYQNSLLSANNSLDLFETNEMLLHRIHCLRIMKRFAESLQYLEQLIEKNRNPGSDEKRISLANLNAIKRYIIRQMATPDDFSFNDFSLESMNEELSNLSEPIPEGIEQSRINVWIHPSCQLKCNEVRGRHFTVDHFIPKGTVLLVEQPSSVVIYKDSQNEYCLNCRKNCKTQIWPCIGCDEVVFCSKECFLEGFDNFHQYECGIVSLIFRFGHNFLHIFRLISRVGVRKAFECENENKNFDFKSYIESQREEIENHSSVRYSKEDSFYETEFRAFQSTAEHTSERNKYSYVYHIFKSIETALLFEYTKQLDFDIEEDFDSFVDLVNICLIHSNRVHTNVFGWFQTKPLSLSPVKRIHVGSAFCNVASLCNHSCEPNLFWEFRNGYLCYSAYQDINAGEEINITYGPTYRTSTFLERQKKLKSAYNFDCSCKACLRDCQTVLCIKCEQCLGAVVYKISLPSNMKRVYSCLHCGHEYQYEDLKKLIVRVEGSLNTFTQMMKHLDNNYNIELSLNMAQKSLNTLLALVYSKCEPLKDSIRQLVRVYALYGRFGEALQYIKHFDYVIESDEDSMNGDILDDLLLLTNCYYMYLNENKLNDTNHWNMCFQLYSKLIEVLKKGKKCSKRMKTDEQLLDTTTLKDVIKDKKGELKQLKEYYNSVANQL